MKRTGFGRSVGALCTASLCAFVLSVVGAQPCAAISWSPWSLQLPNNQTVDPASTRNAWFYPDGSYQAFMDPKTGTPTSGSSHPRCELRENRTWSSSGNNVLNATARVTKTGGGTITIG